MKGHALVVAALVAFRTSMHWTGAQWTNTKESLPKLSGNTIWVSGKEGDGFDIVLSQDAKAKVEGVLEGCGKADNKCYQDVLDTLQSADLELDNKLDRQYLGNMLAKAIKGAWPLFSDISIMLNLNWQMKSAKMDSSAFHLPQTKAEEAAKLASATSVVHSAGGSVTITVTPRPEPTTLTGSAAPAITTATSDAKGHKRGEILVTLDADLAGRINEVAHRMTDCEDGRKFDTEHGLRKRAGTATYGQALCAAEGVIGMSGKGGPFADLTMLSHDKVGIEFAQNAGKAKDALLVLKDFIIAYSPVLAIPEDLVEQLGTYVLAIIIDAVVIEHIPIGPTNFIGPDLAVTYGAMSRKPTPTSASATSSSTGCPDPSKTPLLCGWEEEDDCDAQLPDQKAKGEIKATCANSKWKGCKCNTPVISYEYIIGAEEHQGMQLALKLFKEFKDHSPAKKAKIACRKHPLSAPRRDKDADGGTSVEKAIDNWCRDNDGKDVGSDGLYWRWGITQLSVPNRSSFWLRASKTCDKPEKFNQAECKKALMDGMKQCDKDSKTHGLTASVGCLDYSIDLSGITDGDIPPWAEKEDNRKFPPPEFAEKKGGGGQGNVPVCDKGVGERPLSDGDLNKAIDAFCQDGTEIKGYGKWWSNLFDYPPQKEPQFYNNDGYKMHLTFGAETINNSGPEPYQDMSWCKNYDWKLGKEDCTYALRKLYKTCTKNRKKHLNGGEYTYRCVHYKSWPVNTRD